MVSTFVIINPNDTIAAQDDTVIDAISPALMEYLDALEVGDEIRISFIRKNDPVLIGKLVSFGVAPGKRIKIRQKFPAYVIQIENTQIALEQDIAAAIYGLKI